MFTCPAHSVTASLGRAHMGLKLVSLASWPHTPAGQANAHSRIWLHLSLSFFFLTFKIIYLFIYLFLAALGLRCCARAFSSCGEQGATLCCGARASHCGGFSCCGAGALGTWASVVVAHGLSSCGSRALEHRLSSCGPRA